MTCRHGGITTRAHRSKHNLDLRLEQLMKTLSLFDPALTWACDWELATKSMEIKSWEEMTDWRSHGLPDWTYSPSLPCLKWDQSCIQQQKIGSDFVQSREKSPGKMSKVCAFNDCPFQQLKSVYEAFLVIWASLKSVINVVDSLTSHLQSFVKLKVS